MSQFELEAFGCARSTDKEWLDSMSRNNCEPNQVTFGTILRQCEKMHKVQTAERIWSKMSNWNVEPNLVLFNSIINVYAGERQPIQAEEKFRDMVGAKQIPDLMTFGALVKAAARAPDVPRARLWLERASRAGEEPDDRTFASLLSACAQVGDVKEFRAILQQMELYDIPQSVRTYSLLVRTYAAAGDLKAAEAALDDMMRSSISPNSFTTNAIVMACDLAQQPLSAERWFSRLAALGAQMDIIVLNSLLKAWVNEDPLRMKAWLRRCRMAGVRPDVISYNLLLNSAAIMLDKGIAEAAWSRIKAAHLRPTLASYRTFSKVLARDGDYRQLAEILDAAAQWRPRDVFCERAFISACANAKPKAAQEAEEAFLASQHLLRDDALAQQALRLAVGDARFAELSTKLKLQPNLSKKEAPERENPSREKPTGQLERRAPTVRFVVNKAATDFSMLPAAIRLTAGEHTDNLKVVIDSEPKKEPLPERPEAILSSASEPSSQLTREAIHCSTVAWTFELASFCSFAACS